MGRILNPIYKLLVQVLEFVKRINRFLCIVTCEAYGLYMCQNMEAEKQVKFFQSCVAAAFAERDQAIIEVMTVAVFY